MLLEQYRDFLLLNEKKNLLCFHLNLQIIFKMKNKAITIKNIFVRLYVTVWSIAILLMI